MIIDVSSFQGSINWTRVLKENDIERIVLRSTTKNGNLDTRLMENFNGILQNAFNGDLDVYKFAYSKTYGDALIESQRALIALKDKGILRAVSIFWLDIENINGVRFSPKQAAEIIAAYRVMCEYFGVKFGIYANYDYVKNVLPEWAAAYPLWLARYNSITGNVRPFDITMWQYTSNGQVNGINGAVDISRYVSKEKL